MRNTIFIIFLIMSNLAFSQDLYTVIAPEGLTIRTAPNGKRVGKIPYGYSVKIIETGEPFSLLDNGKSKKGNWVKIDLDSAKLIVDQGMENEYDPSQLFTFSGYLITKRNFTEQFEREIGTHPALNDFYLATAYDCFAIKGDFFGDGVVDYLIRMTAPNGKTRLMIINNLKKGSQIYGLGGAKDPFKITDYDFPILTVVPKGTQLWSNSINGKFRDFKDVPKSEIVTLNYDAIYIHQENKKEGGFIFRKDDKWNWFNQK